MISLGAGYLSDNGAIAPMLAYVQSLGGWVNTSQIQRAGTDPLRFDNRPEFGSPAGGRSPYDPPIPLDLPYLAVFDPHAIVLPQATMAVALSTWLVHGTDEAHTLLHGWLQFRYRNRVMVYTFPHAEGGVPCLTVHDPGVPAVVVNGRPVLP